MITIVVMKKCNIDEKKTLITFGSNVRIIRNNLKISQEELAFQANLDRGYISDIEKGKRNVSILVIKQISLALNVTVAKLLEEV